MKKYLSLFLFILLFACSSSSKFSLPDKYPLTQLSNEKGVELYKYRSSLGNTCLIGVMSGTDNPNITFVSGVLNYDFLKSMSTVDKRSLENSLNEIIKDFDVAIIDDKIIFMDQVDEKLSKIPQGILMERVKKVGEFTCSYAAILEEIIKKGDDFENE